jgi:hypothetical protein
MVMPAVSRHWQTKSWPRVAQHPTEQTTQKAPHRWEHHMESSVRKSSLVAVVPQGVPVSEAIVAVPRQGFARREVVTLVMPAVTRRVPDEKETRARRK